MYPERDYTDLEIEWLDDQYYWYGDNAGLTQYELDLVKGFNCDRYRKDDCHGCPYYSEEDQVCRFDK